MSFFAVIHAKTPPGGEPRASGGGFLVEDSQPPRLRRRSVGPFAPHTGYVNYFIDAITPELHTKLWMYLGAQFFFFFFFRLFFSGVFQFWQGRQALKSQDSRLDAPNHRAPEKAA